MKTLHDRCSKASRATCSTALRIALLAIGLFTVSGCVSTKYQFVKSEIPPDPLNLATLQSTAEATVNGVIVFQGSGSWKKRAYWDEYMVSITNHGSTPLSIESAMLVGLASTPHSPGADPWSLEKASRTEAQRNFGLAKDISTQVGGGAALIGAATVLGGATVSGTSLLAANAAATAASVTALAAVPVAVGVTIYRNVRGRRKVEAEVTRRRLVLPAIVAPAETLRGSLFFQITPGPQRLIFRCGTAGELRDLTIDLSPLANLHLKSPASAK